MSMFISLLLIMNKN